MREKSKTIVSVVVLIVMTLALALSFAMIKRYLDNGQRSFYVQFLGKDVAQSEENVRLAKGTHSIFYCRYVTDLISSDKQDYSLRITPNANVTDFDFFIDSEQFSFKTEQDLTAGFSIVKSNDYFSIFIPSDITMQSILERIYVGKTVETPSLIFGSDDYFTLTVTSQNKESVSISFTIGGLL